MIERIEDDAGFIALRDDWSSLLAECDADSVFLTWEWLYAWWRHVGCRLRPAIVTVRTGGKLRALAPLAAKGWEPSRLRLYRSLTFLGTPLATGNVGSDYLDVLVSRSHPRAAEQLAAAVASDGRVLELAQVAATASTADLMILALRCSDWELRRQESGVCPLIDLGGHTWESYLASRGREHRYAVQRKLRKLHKDFAVSFDWAKTEEERREALGLLIDLHERRWKEKGESNAFNTPALRAFHATFTQLALERGWLRLYVLRLDGQPAAALYGLFYGRTFSFYQSGFDPAFSRHGVGVATMALSIEAALREGASCYDMLHGEEEYKFHWANRTRPLAHYVLFPPRPQGLVARALADASSVLRPMARRVLLHP